MSQPGPEYVNGDIVNPRATQLGNTSTGVSGGPGNTNTSHQNEGIRVQSHGATSSGSHRDPFDMSKYNLMLILYKLKITYNIMI